MDIDQLAPDEPLSPELVLVLPPELRAEVLACLPAPAWTTPRWVVEAPAAGGEPFAPPLAGMLAARVVQLAAIFVIVTILTLALALVAHAMRETPSSAASRSGGAVRPFGPVGIPSGAVQKEVWKPA